MWVSPNLLLLYFDICINTILKRKCENKFVVVVVDDDLPSTEDFSVEHKAFIVEKTFFFGGGGGGGGGVIRWLCLVNF